MTLDLDRAFERVHDSATDRKPETGSAPGGFRRHERVEDTSQQLRGNAGAGVLHFDAHAILVGASRPDGDRVLHSVARVDRLGRVDDQIQEHLTDSRPRTANVEVAVLVLPHHGGSVLHLGLRHSDRGIEHLLQVDRFDLSAVPAVR